MIFPRGWVLSSCCFCPCHASHIMSSCASHLHTCLFHASEHFPYCPFCIPALRSPPVIISSFLSCVGMKHFRIGPGLAKQPWFTTGRPPIKFRIIWTSFDAPTVNRGTEKASCVLQPNTPPIWPKTLSIISSVPSRSRGQKPHLIWTLLAPSTYKYVQPFQNSRMKP